MAADPQPHDVELAVDDGMAHREGRASVRSPRDLVDADDTGQLLDAQPGAKPYERPPASICPKSSMNSCNRSRKRSACCEVRPRWSRRNAVVSECVGISGAQAVEVSLLLASSAARNSSSL